MIIFEVRYDDDEAYHVVARFTDLEDARLLRKRIVALHAAVDKDDCEVGSEWVIESVTVDGFDSEGPLLDLFEEDRYAEGHVMVAIDKFPLVAAGAVR